MNKKIISLIGIIIVIAVVVALFFNITATKEDTKIKMVSNSSLDEDSSIEIKLINLNNTPIDNQTVYIKIIDDKGNVEEHSVKTDENGNGKLNLNKIKPGNYTVNFTYNGNEKYNSCNLSKEIEIVEKIVVEEQNNYDTSSSSSSYNSESDGYWETSPDAPFEYHTEYDSSGGFRQYDRAGNLVGSSYDEDQDDIADYVPRRI